MMVGYTVCMFIHYVVKHYCPIKRKLVMKTRITPEEARAYSIQSKRSVDDILSQVYSSIESSSKAGSNNCCMIFTKEALLPNAIDEAYQAIAKDGWKVDLKEAVQGHWFLSVSF